VWGGLVGGIIRRPTEDQIAITLSLITSPRPKLPDGQITRSSGDSVVESFFCLEAKYSCSSRRANQTYNSRRPGPQRGVS
jgi:hypothetical protein